MRVLRIGIMAALCGGPCFGGNLNPPIGPVSPTMKTLEEVEPRRLIEQSDIPLTINASGSYYLTSNLFPVGIGDPYIIRVIADDVTIDLRGFAIIGSTEVSTADDGILVEEGTNGLEVHSGTITKCLDAGIDAFTLNFDTRDCVFRNLRLVDNLSSGLEAGVNSVIVNCVASRNAGIGFFVAPGTALLGSASTDNGASGIASFLSGDVVIQNCAVRNNATGGIVLFTGARINGCSITNNGDIGVQLLGDSVISDCSVLSNSGGGIVAGSGSIVRHCAVASNSGHGISASSDCLILENVCSFNTSGAIDAAGVFVSGSDNRIDENTCSENELGFDIAGAGNLVVRNSASDNPVADYQMVGGNDIGQLQGSPIGAGAWDNFLF